MQDPVAEFFNPVLDELDTVLDEWVMEKTAGVRRSQRDLELWQQWDQNGRQAEDLEPLYKQIKPVIRKAANVYAGKVNIPRPAVEAEFELHALNALSTYNPKKASLHTYVTSQMRRGKRFITTHQNAARIPEHRITRKGDFDRAKSELEDELGREPSAQEIADRMKWPKRQVERLIMEDRKEVPTSLLQTDLVGNRVSEETELLNLLPAELSREENLVFEYLTGSGGKQQLRAAEIARKTGMSAAKVSRIRSRIAKKVKKYYSG